MLSSLRNPKCKLCELHKSAKTVCIMGTGNPKAKIMLLGEAPGEDEDKKGEPFVGKAGILLDSILDNVEPKIVRKKVFITNVTKCHPFMNSKPNLAMIDMCASTYLAREIKLVQPELIVCLGGMSGKTLLGEANIKVADRRNTIYYTKGPMPQGIPFIITFHPAATFHQPELLEFIVEDLEWAQRLIAGELPSRKKVKYEKLDTLYAIPGIGQTRWIDIDLETDGLDPFIDGKDILSLQVSIKEGEAYYFDWSKKINKELKDLLVNPKGLGVNIKVNGHNTKFDLKWLRMKAGIIFEGRVNDTIQDLHLLDENFPRKSLDVVATAFTELKGYKKQLQDLIKKFVKFYKEKKEPIRVATTRLFKKAFFSISERVRIKYGCGDADATGRLRRKFRPRIIAAGLGPLHKLMGECTKQFVDIECNGMKVDVLEIGRQKEVYEKKLRIHMKQLTKLGGDINHSAPLQVRELLYRKWRCEPHTVKMGKKWVRYSTGKDALELILKDDINENVRQYIGRLLDFRKDSKLYGTYIVGMPKHIRNESLIHPEWNLTGAESGRYSCSNPNAQQIPRTGDIKAIFISRWPKGILLQIDVSQGELRIAAHESNARSLIKIFRSGTADVHTSMAQLLLNKPKVSSEERYSTKQVNFLILYGGGARMMAQEIRKERDMSEAEALAFIDKWHTLVPEWKEHEERMRKLIIERGWIRNSFGRYRNLLVLNPDSETGKAQIRKGINAQIQGGLNDYNKLCGVNVWHRLKREGLDSHCLFIFEGHDSFLLDIEDMEYVPQVYKILKEEFENVDTSEFGFKFKVPMKIEVKGGRNWKNMEVYEE